MWYLVSIVKTCLILKQFPQDLKKKSYLPSSLNKVKIADPTNNFVCLCLKLSAIFVRSY